MVTAAGSPDGRYFPEKQVAIREAGSHTSQADTLLLQTGSLSFSISLYRWTWSFQSLSTLFQLSATTVLSQINLVSFQGTQSQLFCHSMQNEPRNHTRKKLSFRGSDGSAVTSAPLVAPLEELVPPPAATQGHADSCSSRFSFRDPTLSSDHCEHMTHTWCTETHAVKTSIHIK